jgi:hypothetical protein
MPQIRTLYSLGMVDNNGVDRRIPTPIINTISTMSPSDAEAYLMARLDLFWPSRPVDIYIHVYQSNPLNLAWLVNDLGTPVIADWWVNRG